MPSLSGNNSDANKPARLPPLKGRRSKRRGGPRETKHKSRQIAGDQTSPDIRQSHDHLLRMLREEAKTLNDPLLLYLYDMVIYRTEVGDPKA